MSTLREEAIVREPVYVFLDQNHWIHLAQAFWGRPHAPAHCDALQYLVSKVDCDDVRLPLLQIHLMEHYNADDAGRRDRLAEVFDRFSRGWSVAAWNDVLPTEIMLAIPLTFGHPDVPAPPQVFGKGVLFGIGPEGWSAFPPHWSRAEVERLNRFSQSPGALHNFLTLPHEPGRIQAKTGIADVGGRNARAAEQLRAARRPYPKAMHRRAQLVGYVDDLRCQIAAALAAIGKTFDDFSSLGADGLDGLWSQVPTMHVDCELTLYRDRQWSRPVKANDVYDIGQLVTAVPYCDVVVVERFWARAIQETGLAEKYGTAVCADLTELPAILEEHVPPDEESLTRRSRRRRRARRA
jgi:hypothetical protein